MPKMMKFTTVFCFMMSIFTTILYRRFNSEICITLAVTFGTITYHLGMRLLVGLLYNIGMKNRANYTKKWYRIHSWEHILYQFLKVKKWKAKMPTYNSDIFSNKKYTWDEIAQAMCQSQQKISDCLSAYDEAIQIKKEKLEDERMRNMRWLFHLPGKLYSSSATNSSRLITVSINTYSPAS